MDGHDGVPPLIRELTAAADSMSTAELATILGPILTVLCKRLGAAKAMEAVEAGIKIAEAQLAAKAAG